MLPSFKDENYVEKTVVGPIPDVKAYSLLIDTYSRIGEVNKALSLLRRMSFLDSNVDEYHYRNVKPNTKTYNSVLYSLGTGYESAGERW